MTECEKCEGGKYKNSNIKHSRSGGLQERGGEKEEKMREVKRNKGECRKGG